ncbi:MAG: FliH/SctL family protein [Myxococcota bacterium]
MSKTNWSSRQKIIFDGGAIGRDSVSVFDAQTVESQKFRVYRYQGVDETDQEQSQEDRSPPTNAQPPSLDPSPPPSVGISPEDAQKAESEAFERGLAQGRQIAKEDLDSLSDQLKGAAEFFRNTILKIDARASDQAMKLGLMLAEQLFRKTISLDPDRMLGAVKALVDSIDEESPLKIIVDPPTAQHWRGHEASLQTLLPQRSFEIESSEDLSTGDIIVHCGHQTLDERLAHRIKQYEQAILQELDASKPEMG